MAMNGGITEVRQRRAHGGHSHAGHHHHHDNTYLTSQNKNDPGVKITRVGLYVNLGMAVAKGAGGIVFNSKALIADAVHALTDLMSDVMTLATISYSLRHPTSRFPLGYGKVESLGALAVSGFLLSGGLAIGIQAILALSQQFFPELAHNLAFLEMFGHSHSHDHGVEHQIPIDGHSHDHGVRAGPNINAAWLAGGSIIIKEWLYRATMKIAKEKKSTVLESNAYHHRVDSLTAIVALVTILASQLLHNAAWLDPVGGLLISGMIVQAGYGNTKAALFELVDVSFDKEVEENCTKAAGEAIASWSSDVEIRGVQGIKSGQNFLVDVEIAAPATWTISKQNEVEIAVREKMTKAVRGVHRVSVRFVVKDDTHGAPFADQFAHDRGSGTEEHEHDHDHDHDHIHGHSHEHDHKHANGKAK